MCFKEIKVRVTLPVLEITGCQVDARRNRKGQHQWSCVRGIL